MITPAMLEQLKAPFPAAMHSFRQGFVFLSEEVIAERLDSVDLDWSFIHVNTYSRTNETTGDVQIVSTFRLTVCGVSRDGVGMERILTTKPRLDKTTGEVISGSSEANEPEKGAATDAFKRAARLFGIGRYILEIPIDPYGKPTVTNTAQLAAWLQKRAATPQSAEKPPVAMDPPKVPENAGNGAQGAAGEQVLNGVTTKTASAIWTYNRGELLKKMAELHPAISWKERDNTVKKIEAEGGFKDRSFNDCVAITRARLSKHHMREVQPELPTAG